MIVTPGDEEADPGLTERMLRYCWQQARGPVAFSHFGAQWDCFWDEAGKALDRGIRLCGVLDSRQFAGPSEQRTVKPFIERYPEVWKRQDIVVGTERVKSAIVHDKKMCWNAPLYGFQPTIGDFETVEDAFAAGACVSWFGSLNMSKDASQQANTIAIIPGIIVGQMFVAHILDTYHSIAQNQQRYQPYPRLS